MPTYEVVRGDTVWGLTRRALTESLGRVPTNREILEIVNQVSVPSGNVDLIFPGEQITIPVGPGYEDTPAAPIPDGGISPTPGQSPNNPQGVRPGQGVPDGGIYMGLDSPGESRAANTYGNRPAAGGGPGDRPGEQRVTPTGGQRTFLGIPIRGDWSMFDNAPAPGLAPGPGLGGSTMPNLAQMTEQEQNEYIAANLLLGGAMAGGLGALYAGGGAAAAPAAARALPSGARLALPAGTPAAPAPVVARTASGAIPLGPGTARVASGAIPLGPGGGAAASAGPRAVSEAALRASRNVIPFRYPVGTPGATFGAVERRLLMGPGGYMS